MNFVEGALWSEAGAGTNAVGTALAADHAVQVFAAEHFTEPVQRWTCAAAPVTDPDTGRLLGIIDLTGDMASVHPHSLSVVVATARAIQELLQRGLRERDDRLRARYGNLLRPESAGAALVTRSGRVLLDPTQHWALGGMATIPVGGGPLVLPSGLAAVAEPLEDGDAYLVRPRAQRVRVVRPVLELRLLGAEPEVVLDGRMVAAAPPPRRTAHPPHPAPRAGGRRRPVRRALRRRRPPGEHPGRDVAPAQAAARRHRPPRTTASSATWTAICATCGRCSATTRSATPRPRTPDRSCRSPTPRASAANARSSRAGCARRSSPPGTRDALWSWVRTASGDDDLVAWQRLLAAIDYADPRRSLAAARTAALRRSSV